jgi:hypothetical protein
MADFGSLALLSRCVDAVSGINAESYTADISCDLVKTPNECGENVQAFTRNVTADHNWQGEIRGPTVSGAVVYNVGAGVTPPPGVWGRNMTPGASFICTKANPQFSRGEWAKFSFTLNNSEGI